MMLMVHTSDPPPPPPSLQSRPHIFDLQIRCPDTLYEEVVEVDAARFEQHLKWFQCISRRLARLTLTALDIDNSDRHAEGIHRRLWLAHSSSRS